MIKQQLGNEIERWHWLSQESIIPDRPASESFWSRAHCTGRNKSRVIIHKVKSLCVFDWFARRSKIAAPATAMINWHRMFMTSTFQQQLLRERSLWCLHNRIWLFYKYRRRGSKKLLFTCCARVFRVEMFLALSLFDCIANENLLPRY